MLICFPSFRSFADTSSLFLNKTALTAAISLACLAIRSSNEEAINFSRNRIYSLKDFSSYFIDVDTFYLFLNWLVRVSATTGNTSAVRLYVCINTRTFKGFDSREITSLPEIKNVIYMVRLSLCSIAVLSGAPISSRFLCPSPLLLLFLHGAQPKPPCYAG